MAFVSVTRLRPRSVRFLPLIGLHTWRSWKQLRRAAGFLGGYLATGPRLALWTVTVWTDEASMRAYRNASPHLKAMPRLLGSCDEASVVHWETDYPSGPTPTEAAEKMKQGRTSKVRHPTPAHAAGNTWPDCTVPREGPSSALRSDRSK
jgi:hypothetical protein